LLLRGEEEVTFPMSRKIVGQRLSAAGLALAAVSATAACGQGPSPEPSESSTDALGTVLDCQTQAGTCLRSAKSAADLVACNGSLRSCLMSLFPDSGAPRFPGPIGFDASFPPIPTGLPSFDAGPPLPRFDAGLPPPPQFDAGFPPFPTFDAGPPRPPAGGDAGVPSQPACLLSLQACLFSQTPPTTCADQARACLTAAQHAQCVAQKAQCVAARIPAATCAALNPGC
jgi:hypothetical protein